MFLVSMLDNFGSIFSMNALNTIIINSYHVCRLMPAFLLLLVPLPLFASIVPIPLMLLSPLESLGAVAGPVTTFTSHPKLTLAI